MNLIEVTVYLHIDADSQQATVKMPYDGRTLTGERSLAETGHKATADVSPVELTFDLPADVDMDSIHLAPTQTFSGGRYGAVLEADGIEPRVADFDLERLNLELVE